MMTEVILDFAVVIFALFETSLKAGIAIEASIARTATTTTSSIRLKPA